MSVPRFLLHKFSACLCIYAVTALLNPSPLAAEELLPEKGWLFAPGDNPRRAAMDFDDRDWQSIEVPAYWNKAGVSAKDGFGWYRLHISLPPGKEALELVIKGLAGEDETYFNGKKIGSTGELSGDFSNPKYVIRTYTVPAELRRSQNILAIRIYAGKTVWGGGIIRPVSLRELKPEEAIELKYKSPSSGNFIKPGEKFSYTVECKNRRTEATTVKLQSTLNDFEGKELERFDYEISLAPGEIRSWEKEILLPEQGIYTVNSSIIFKNATVKSESLSIGVMPERPADSKLDPRFGVACHLNWWDSKTSIKLLDLMRRAGIGTARTGMIWRDIEEVKGQMDFSRCDLIAEETARRGIIWLPTLSDVPDWAVSGKGAGNPAVRIPDINAWKNFVNEAVKRYGSRIKVWEIGNEPNLNKLSPEEYQAQYSAAREAALKVKPDAVIAVGGLSSVHIKQPGRILPDIYLSAFHKLNMDFDALAYHPYVGWPKENAAIVKDFNASLDSVENVLKADAQPGKKLYLTEYAISKRTDQDRSELDQARFLVLTSATALTRNNVAVICWYNLRNKGVNSEDNEMNYGLLNFDLSPKIAFLAYSTMIRQLEFLNYESNYKDAEGVAGYIFSDATRKVLLVWSESGKKRISLNGASEICNLVGASRKITEDGTVEVSELPLYITIKR